MGRAPAPTWAYDLRACVPPVSGPLKEAPFLQVEKASAPRAEWQGWMTATRSLDVGEKPYLSTPSIISHVFYSGVYPIRMAWGEMARTYRLAWLNISFTVKKGQVKAVGGPDCDCPPATCERAPRRLHSRPLPHLIRRAQRKSHGSGTSLGPGARGGAGIDEAIDVDGERS